MGPLHGQHRKSVSVPGEALHHYRFGALHVKTQVVDLLRGVDLLQHDRERHSVHHGQALGSVRVARLVLGAPSDDAAQALVECEFDVAFRVRNGTRDDPTLSRAN